MRKLLAPGFLLFAAIAGADVLHLKDGARVSGKLTFCDEEICSIDKRRIPLTDIAQIELRPVEPIPLGARNGGVVLVDGSVRTGSFTGLTLGYVEAGGEEIDRADVALILLVPVVGADVIVDREGASRTGQVTTCNAASCTLDGGTVPFGKLAWIGLAQEGETPPVADADTVFLLEGNPVAARLSALDATTVRTTRGSFPRTDVTWIHLAARPEDAPSGAQPGTERPPDEAPPPGTTPPASAPPSRPPGTPPPPSPSPSPPAPAADTPTRGGLWTGTMDLRGWGTADDTYWDHRIHTDVRMREYISPLIIFQDGKVKTIGKTIFLEPEGSVVHITTRCTSQYLTCSGEGTTRVTITPGEPNRSHASVIYLKTAPGSMQASHGFELPVGGSLYMLAISPYEDYTVTFRSSATNDAQLGYVALIAGGHPLAMGELHDPQVRHLEGGMMRGTYTIPGAGAYPKISVSWSVCPERMACPPPAPVPDGPPEDSDPCARAGQKAAFADTCRKQLDLLFDALGPAFDEYNARMASAEANRQAFQNAQEFCELYDKAKEILEAIITGGTGPAAEAARSLLYLRDVIAKVQSGDLASMLYPKEVKEFLKYYKKAKAIWFELTADEISKMRRDLGACSGKVPIETYLKAKKFIEDLDAAKKVWDTKVAPGLNDLRTKGLECASLNHEAWQECLDDAKCREVPPDCGEEPTLAGAYDDE